MGLEPVKTNMQKSWFWRPLSRKHHIWASQDSLRFWYFLWLWMKTVSSFILSFIILFISLRNRVSVIAVVKIDFRVFLQSKMFCFCRTSHPKWPLYFFITHQKKYRSFRKVWISIVKSTIVIVMVWDVLPPEKRGFSSLNTQPLRNCTFFNTQC